MIIKNLIISGGGFKGFSIIGALSALDKFHILDVIEKYIGSSIGSIFALLISMKYNHSDLYDFILNFEYEKISDVKILNFFDNYGLETGDKIMLLIKKLILKKCGKPTMTFKEHFDLFKTALIVNSVCINDSNVVYFSYFTHPDMQIIDAIRASISIPILFTPMKIDNKYYIDGGLIDNFSIHMYPPECSLGIRLIEQKCQIEIKSFDVYLIQTIKCIHSEICKMKYGDLSKYVIINIETDCNPLNINLTKEDRIKLYRTGYSCAKKILSKHFKRKNLMEELLNSNNDTENLNNSEVKK